MTESGLSGGTLDADLRRWLRAPRHIVPIIGAGVSQAAGLPSAGILAETIADAFPDCHPPNRADLQGVVQEVWQRPDAESIVSRVLERQLGTAAQGRCISTVALKSLARAPSRLVLTLNYDRLLERVAQEEGVPVKSYGVTGLAEAREALRDAGNDEVLHIVYVHGRLGDPVSQLVLGPWGAQQRERAQGFIVQQVMPWRRVLFLGTSLRETHVLAELDRWPSSRPTHLYVGLEPEIEGAAYGRVMSDGTLGIGYIRIGDHGVIDAVCDRLVNQPTAPIAALAPSGESIAPIDTYVPTTLVLRDDDPDSLRWSAALDLVDFVQEDEIVSMRRTVVLGDAGSGKSELLRWILDRPPPDESVAFLRAREIRDFEGDPVDLLVAWVQSAYADSAAVGRAQVEGSALTLLIDGLDELRQDGRRSLVQSLSQLARELPNCRFIITSRRVADVNDIPADWQRVTLVPEIQWPERYLEALGHSWESLEEAVPAARALGDLRRRPLYLATLVKLATESDRASLRYPLDLLVRLLEVQIERADLGPSGKYALPWLHRLAVGSICNEADELGLDLAVAVPLDARAVAPDDVIDRLVQRTVLVPGPDCPEFAIRLIRDALAAHWLCELVPAELDQAIGLLIPSSDHGTAVLDEWSVPLQLAAEAKSSLRDLAKERDALTAALGTPHDAHSSERRWAAGYVINRYREEEWSISDPFRPRVRSALDRLAMLMQGQEFTELMTDLYEDLKRPGTAGRNAVRILGAIAAPEDLEEWLLRGFESTDDGVRNATARVVAERGLVGLREPLTQEFFKAPAGTRGDLARALITVTPDDSLLGVAQWMVQVEPPLFDLLYRDVRGRLGNVAALRFWKGAVPVLDRGFGSEGRRQLSEAIEALDGDAEATRDAAFIAASVHFYVPALEARARQTPEPVLRGFLDAVAEGHAHDTELLPYLQFFDESLLVAEGAPPRIVDARRQQAAPGVSVAIGDLGGPDADGLGAAPTPPSMDEVMDDWSDETLVSRLDEVIPLFQGADDDERRLLRARAQRLWPEGEQLGIRASLGDQRTWVFPSGQVCWLIDAAPQLGLEVPPAHWAELVAAGFGDYELFQDWLKQGHSPEAEQALVARDISDRADVWASIASVIPDQLSADLVHVLTDRLTNVDREGAERLVAVLADRVPASVLRQIHDDHPASRDAVRWHLASKGDVDAQREVLDGLPKHLYDRRPDRAALDAVTDKSLLPNLFEAVLRVAGSGPSAGHPDLIYSDLHAAIQRIGGDDAIDLCDAQLGACPVAAVPGLQRLRSALLQDVLRQGSREDRQAFLQGMGVVRS